MTPEQYAARQQLITYAVAAFTYQFGKLFTYKALSPAEWLGLLRFLFPEVSLRRQQAATLAREFYDSQRAIHVPNLPMNEVTLEGTDFDVFVQAMEPVRKRMSQAESPKDALTMLSLQVVREVENAGRRQIIHAVQTDEPLKEEQRVTPQLYVPPQRTVRQQAPEPVVESSVVVQNLRDAHREIAQQKQGGSKLIRGWARVATGRETCGWCLMLISRGPVYYDAHTAGLDLDSESAAAMIAAGEDVSQFMEEWHTGCDCKVVPVFKTDDWENSPYGRAAERALDLWGDAMAEAREILKENPDKVHTKGKQRGEEVTLNEEAINALRRRLARGGINPAEFAGLAA